MPELRILVVDDEPGMLEVCEDALREIPGIRVRTEPSSERALELLASDSWELLITDLRMPGVDGLELLRAGRSRDPDLPVLILTAFPSVDTAVESMKLGAADYLTKPFLPDDLILTVKRLIEARRLREENQLLRRHVERRFAFGEMVGRSPAIRAVFDIIEQVAPTSVDVLITGETGTGKELVARSIHERSQRSAARFVPVDCGAIPEELLESELFGHERGAFTGAHNKSLGLLEFAHRGTFFMDEVAQLSPKLQAKLLRALQERRIRRVGGTQEKEVDVRVLAATSLDLQAEVDAQRFRMDLFYRINVAHIPLPPLRERIEDIPLLLTHFGQRYAREMGKDGLELDSGAVEVLCGYAWPGNVRELQNVLKRTIALCRSELITADDLPDALVASSSSAVGRPSPGFFELRDQHVAGFERDYFERLLASFHGNISQAAAEARLPRGTFYRLLGRHDIDPSSFRD
ncbi:MAG TPA: sigma-54 dependent transcriptional regulator [Longimicrobiales bacterium]|nr:sigma-54 dependent transcriptional regulator [Longimicrobiales bacterium]